MFKVYNINTKMKLFDFFLFDFSMNSVFKMYFGRSETSMRELFAKTVNG